MNGILKQVTSMFEKELYSNVTRVVELALSICDQRQDTTPIMKFQLHILCADSHFNLQQYVPAEIAYLQALQTRKYIMKTKNNGKLAESIELTSDVDIRYKMHICYVKLKQMKKAVEILQNIPMKSKNAKIYMALGNLYRDAGCERPSISCFREVLKENSLALEAAENLFKLGVNGAEVNSLMLEATSELTWISTWLRGHAQMHSRDYQSAVNTFKTLDCSGLLNCNSSFLVTMAYCYTYMCDTKNAIVYLQRAMHVDFNLKTGKDLYASLLAQSQEKEHLRELEKLISTDIDTSMWSCEHWVAVGYHMYANKKYDRAAYFGQQACSMNRKCVEALFLKAYTFMQINKFSEALIHFKEARTYAPYRFEAHKGIVECYIALNRAREAATMAGNAMKQLNNSPQSITLYATVLMKDPDMSLKVRELLDKALAADPSHLPAIWLLAEHFDQEQRHEEACAVLSKHVENYPSSRTHQLLAECLVHLQREEEAFIHYNSALRLDPSNQRATEGLNNIGRALSKIDSTYYMSLGGESSSYASQGPSVPSDHDIDVESDSDVWASNDFMTYD